MLAGFPAGNFGRENERVLTILIIIRVKIVTMNKLGSRGKGIFRIELDLNPFSELER